MEVEEPPQETQNVEEPVNTKTAEEWKLEGNQFFKAQSYCKAIDAYTQAILKDPKEPNYYNNRAACNIILKQYDEVIEDCDKALFLDDKSTKAYRRKANACMNLLRFDEALANYKKFLAIEKDLTTQR